jgi:glycosyl transferase family 25
MLKKFGIEGIYVIHAKKGYEKHEQHINELFNRYKLDFKFITEGEPDNFTNDLLEKYFTVEYKNPKGQLSCTLNHFLAYEQVVANENKYALIFENDPYFLGDFVKKIEKIVNEVEINSLDGFIISLENTSLRFPSYWLSKPDQLLYRAKSGRCAGAYLIDLKGANNILEELRHNKCDTIIDTWHNNLIDKGVIKMYWAHPPLVEQGSHNGKLNSVISSKQKSVVRRIQWLCQKYYKTYIRRILNDKRVIPS